jgi:histidinol-phosphatase (PHP family)
MHDYHLHTKLCKHATGEISEYIERAIQIGLKEICFTDHIPLPNDFDFEHRMKLKQLDLYFKLLEQAQSEYTELTILTGIEADYYRGLEKYLDKLLKKYDFDLVILSVHFVKNWQNGNWVFQFHFPEKTLSAVYEEYLSELIKGIKTGLFDIIGHIDIIKQPGDSLIDMIPQKVAETLDAAKKYNMAVEINSSGLRKEVIECYPGYDWLTEIKRFDLPITIGSDAHSPEQVGFGFNEIYYQIKKHDISKIAVYRKRKIIYTKDID